MAETKLINEFCDIIDSYGGRDKVMKALCYSAKLVAGLNAQRNPELAKQYATASSKISKARATLRLIDDIPTIQYAISYGLGSHEKDNALAALNVVANVVDLLFYPVEKICWLSDNDICKIKHAEEWDVVNSTLWVLSTYLNLMKTLRTFSQTPKKTDLDGDSKLAVDKKALQKRRIEMLSLVRLSLDFTHAVSTLPKGYLWGGKLSTFQVGAIGTLSAAIGIYQIFAKRKLNK